MDIDGRIKHICQIGDFGICGDGKENSTCKINRAIEDIWKHGGGTLVFSAGYYCTGSVRLRSGVKLLLEKGAVLFSSQNDEDFPEACHRHFYGRERGAASALLWAVNENEIEIEGAGIIDGGGSAWWHRKDGRRPCVIEISGCKNVKIKNITIRNSPFWTIHPFASTEITIEGVTIQNPPDSPNTDGIDPESCSDVWIRNCRIDVGDDCIALKAGKENEEGLEFPPCQNVTIVDCVMENGHGGVVIGSELSGGIKNISIQNLRLNRTDRGIRIKTRRRRGNTIENIMASDIVMENVICPLVINCYYRGTTRPEDYEFCSSKLPAEIEPHTPLIQNLRFERIRAFQVRAAAACFEGLPERPIENCIFSDIWIEMDTENETEEEPAMTYEGKRMKRCGIISRNVKNISMKNVKILHSEKADA